MVSVIIPSYKSRGGLVDSINSVLQQTYNDFEIIVVDDNNPDTVERHDTEVIMAKYSGNDKISYIKHEINKNGAAARNTGIKAAKGEYVAFLDDDDIWMPTKLEKQLSFLSNHKEYDCVYCMATYNGVSDVAIPYEGNAIIPLFKIRTSMYTPSLFFTKASLDKIGGFDESFKRHQDYELLAKFFINGFKIGCVKEALIDIRGLGGNQLDIKRQIDLKKQFLSKFDDQLSLLEGQNKGIRKSIIVSQFVMVFYAALSQKEFIIAAKLFLNYFPKSPSSFCSQFSFLVKRYIISRLKNRN